QQASERGDRPVVEDVHSYADAEARHAGGGERRCPGDRAAPPEQPGEDRRGDRDGKYGDDHQSRSSWSAARSRPPVLVRMRTVRTCRISTASSRSSDAPNSTTSGTPAVATKAMRAMPLSTSRKPTIWVIALRRVARVNSPISTTATPIGIVRVSGDGATATTGVVAAYETRVKAAAATREAGMLTSGVTSRVSPPRPTV